MITDKDLAELRESLPCCSILVQSLVARLDRVELERDDETGARKYWASGYYHIERERDQLREENTVLRERVKRMEAALQKILYGEYEFVKYHARQVAQAALKEGGVMEKATCCTCGFQWRKGTDGSHSCSLYMAETIKSLRTRAEAAERERDILKPMVEFASHIEPCIYGVTGDYECPKCVELIERAQETLRQITQEGL